MPNSRARRRPTASRPTQQRTQPRRAAASAPPPSAVFAVRRRVERASAPVLRWLTSRPKALLPLLSVALLIGGLAAPLVLAVPLLAVLVLLVAWLTYLSWPAVDRTGRLVRTVTVGVLAALLVVKLAA